jgi:large subunit ribosomal protein L20
MPRAVDGSRRRSRRKKILGLAKGFWGGRRKLFRVAKGAVMKAGAYAYRDRKARKGEFRALWITRISAACRAQGMSYSTFTRGLLLAGVRLDRKALSNLAIEDPAAFTALVEQARTSLPVAQK